MKKYLKEDWPMYLIFLVVFIVIAQEVSNNRIYTQETVAEETKPAFG